MIGVAAIIGTGNISGAHINAYLAFPEESGKRLAVNAQNRFRDPVMGLKAVLDSGMIGRVLHAQADSFWWRGIAAMICGGGVLSCLAQAGTHRS